jgi:hypothetical protein
MTYIAYITRQKFIHINVDGEFVEQELLRETGFVLSTVLPHMFEFSDAKMSDDDNCLKIDRKPWAMTSVVYTTYTLNGTRLQICSYSLRGLFDEVPDIIYYRPIPPMPVTLYQPKL